VTNARIIGASLLLLCLAAARAGQVQPPAQVLIAPVERRPIELTQPLVAAVSPVTRTTVAAEQEGIVEQRMFDEGQRVEKGEILARVNTDLLKIQLDAAVAAKQTAEAELQAAAAELQRAEREVVRLTQLFESRVAPEKEYRDTLTLGDIASATVATHMARLAERDAEVQRLRTMLRKAETPAPLGGIIARRYVEIGQWIDKGAAIAELLQLDPLFVEVDVPEEVIARIKPGDPARIEIDALGRKGFTGTVEQMLPQADPSSRTFRVKILLPNPDLAVWPGFFARAALSSRSAEPEFLVPKDAIVTQGARSHVIIVRDGKAAVVPVELGRAAADRTSVSGDLRENDWVVIRGNEALRGGEVLLVMNPPATPPASQ
jgi:RND family efflux transporter MFP subunit